MINPHKEQLRRFQERRALQVELKQTIGVNVSIEERGQGPEVFRLQPRPEESAKKSGVGISQAEVRLRPYTSSDSSCELFYAAYARR